MGSSVSPIVVNLYMEKFENKALSTFNGPPPANWFRYVDDTWCRLKKRVADDFFDHINQVDDNIKFTQESCQNNMLPFLDTKTIIEKDGNLQFEVYRKPTHTDQYLAFDSHHPLEHKLAVIKTLFHRADNVITSDEAKTDEHRHLRVALAKCGYQNWTFNKALKPSDQSKKTLKCRPLTNRNKVNITIPYVQGVSEKLRRIFQNFNIATNFKPHSTLRQKLVHPKDRPEKGIKANVIYKLKCEEPNCNNMYIGETSRPLKERYKEHCRKSANRYSSAIYHHLKHNQGHSFNFESTDILDREERWFERGIREAIYERMYNPALNRKGGLRVQLSGTWDNALPTTPHPRTSNKRCSWRPDSKFCYPGRCPGTPSSCTCADGFGGYNCLTISSQPSIMHCLAKLQRIDNGGERDTLEADCGAVTATSTVYVGRHIAYNRLEMTWDSSWIGPPARDWPRPYYINDFRVGIVSASSTWTLFRGVSVLRSGTIGCEIGHDRDDPDTDLHDCVNHGDLGLPTLQHDDRLEFKAKATNGGYVIISNYDSGTATLNPRQYYQGSEVIHTAHFTYDLRDPVHCSIASSCSSKLIEIGPQYTKNGQIQLRWPGWSDEGSGVGRYEYAVYKLQPYGEALGMRSVTPIMSGSQNVSGGAGMVDVAMSEPGTYCFVLTVDDVAGNYQRARRFLIYDDVNNVTVDAHQPLWADSAAVNTSHLWQTDLQDSLGRGAKVSLKWPGRYRNLFHHQHKLLAAIEPYDSPIAAGYEEVTGLPPLQRSRQAIPNTYGIMKVETVFAVDHAGGRSITSPPNTWTMVPDVTAEGVDLDIPRVDGDSVRLWLRAYDIVDNFVQEEVLLHVDSSPPVVQNFWLNRHGVPALAVHHSSDLFTMRFEFEAFDDHSGLHNIQWSLQDLLNSSTVHGEGQVAVRRPSLLHPECAPPHCACIPKDSECYFRNYEIAPDLNKMDIPVGSHDHDYVFVVTVTNNAMLVTTVTFQVTVDESPPTAGHVQNALSGQRDLDFQQDLQLHAWWDGFFDRESGVEFYQYAFANRCLGEDEFGIPQPQQIHNTTGKFASWTAPAAGTYFCTVVAFNPALTPSQSACSDGITVDASPPSVRHVKLKGFHARPGLVTDDRGNVWIVNKNGEREVVMDPPESCRNGSKHREDMDLWPIVEPPYMRNTTSQNCTELGPLPDMGYLQMENHLHVQWEGWDDESGIADYEVGLSSIESAVVSPDIHPYTSTRSHPELKLYHPNLAQGALFYVVIRATNRALLSTSKVLGPVIVDVTPPVIATQINVTHTTFNNEDFLVATWSEGSIYDTEDLVELQLEVAAGHSLGGTELSAFAPVESFLESHTLCPTTPCVALPVSQFEWDLHGDQVYYVTLRVTNSAGLTSSLTSTPYHHNVELPSVGVVFELAEAETDALRQPPDIDHQTSQSDIRCRWFGFAHAYQDISYLAGVGSAAGLDDRYYVTVVARTEAGEVDTTSDGVAVLPLDGQLAGATVSDGSCHTPILFNESLLTHHTSASFPGSCADDVDFQASLTTVHTFWNIPESMEDFVSYVHWTLEKEQSVGGTTWEAVTTISDAPNTGLLVATELQLSPGRHYHSVLQFCHQDGCFQPTVSNGFWVTAESPVPNEINSINYDEANTSLSFSWNEFVTVELTGNEALQTMAMGGYDWTLSASGKESSALGTVLYPWQPILDLRRSGKNITATVALPNPLEFTTCIELLLRGRNKAGLYSVTSREIHDCNDPGSVNIRDPIVFDAIPDFNDTLAEESGISLSTNHFWTVPDEDFTRSRDTLAADWPSLRHGNYYWKVLSADSIKRWSYHRHGNEIGINYHSFRCDEPETLKCGQTKDNFVNVRGLDLQNGQRYFVCVFAEETMLEFEKFQQAAEEVSVCSNGVVVDKEPPVPGEVHVGLGNENYQTSKTELPIVWESFRDVEVHGNTGHQHSGVMKYEYAIGTSPLVMDVLQFVDIGLTNHVVARGLWLQSGHTYYVTVRATDHVGLQATATSAGLTIDTTPPSVTNTRVDVGGRYLMSTDVVSVNWDGLFFDLESECSYSSTAGPGRMNHSGSFESSGEGQVQLGTVPVSRDLVPGERIYVSLWAVNSVGLNSDVAHATFEAVPSNPTSGILDLVRRCEAQSCQGHCTCAPSNQRCQPLNAACNNVTGDPRYTSVDVFDTLDLHTSVSDGQDFNFTRSSTSLAATWRAEQDGRIPVERYEWSAGLAGEAVGGHVFDASTDRIWHDVGSRTLAVLTLPRDGAYASLEPRVPYVWHVRAWYSQSDFAIFTSDGVRSLSLPPQVSASRNTMVRC
ncbi:Hypp6913 [Branchiostoma lanceolatum]|uniref:Hypp6913 protein n=1 Tax=Branchiostoma lanceolatum TaxID=7740 RepID=A0A8J9YVN3_BRALA|nr:Hypp6913 [Branchiostoma lanceolatum]